MPLTFAFLLYIIMMIVLRKYYTRYKPKKWPLKEQNTEKHISMGTVQAIFKRACIKAGIKGDAPVHPLRRSFVTRLLESGVDLSHMQEILGRKSSKRPEIYTHVGTKEFSTIKNHLIAF